ncbi:MAG TPA: AI-2E family transporter [Gaiellaceae bacterium]|nr:AI-2E family transporter [Gaiellaceae bacterium]
MRKDGGGAAASRWRRHPVKSAAATAESIPADELLALRTTFSAPRWLRDIGRTAWLLVGVFALIAGVIWLLAATHTIVGPVVAATVIATVAGPLVNRLSRHMPRIVAAALVLLSLLAIAVLVLVLVIGGITSQHDAIAERSAAAVDKAQAWLEDVGVDKSGAADAGATAKSSAPRVISTLTTGVISGIRGLASVVFGASLALLSLFFLLKDGPMMRGWVDRHLGVPPAVARTITSGVIGSLRGYFRGVTLVAAFNAVVVGLGALLLGVPLAGTIAVVSLVTAYVPFIGAFVAGAFAVVIALGAQGPAVAVAMLIVVLLANGLLQNLVQPFAMGSALDLHPLVVLVVTIGSGCIFGTLGLILAAPLVSAAVHVTRELSAARAQPSSASGSSSAAPTS